MDVRIVRTRRRLQQALFELAQERRIDHISVSDIAERAGVNRTTFYQHYSDRETLLADAMDLITEEADVTLDHIDIDLESADPPPVLVKFLQHIDRHAGLYRQVFTEPGYGVVLARLRSNVYDGVRGTAAATGVPSDVPLDVIAAGVAGSIIGIMGAWLEEDPQAPVEHAAMWVWQLVLGPRAACPRGAP